MTHISTNILVRYQKLSVKTLREKLSGMMCASKSKNCENNNASDIVEVLSEEKQSLDDFLLEKYEKEQRMKANN